MLLKFVEEFSFLEPIEKVQKASFTNRVNLISFLNLYNYIPQRKDIDRK